MKLIWRFVRRHKWAFGCGLFFLSLEAFCDLLVPLFLSKIVDEGVATGSAALVWRYGGIMLGLAATGAGCAVTRNFFASRTSQSVGTDMRNALFARVQGYSFENLDRLPSGALITRMTNDVTQIQNFINGIMRVMVKAPILCAGAILLILLQTPHQAPILLGVLVVVAGLIYANMKLGYPRFGRMQKSLDELNDHSGEFFHAVRVVKAFGTQGHERQRFSDAAEGLRATATTANRINIYFNPLITLTVNAGLVALLWAAGALREGGQVGRIMASVNYMTQILFSLGMVSNILNALIRASASAARVGEVFDEPAAIVGGNATPPPSGRVSFQGVTFHYPGAVRPALADLDLHLEPGDFLSVIGSTGSGKTTLMRLLLRFYDPTSGSVAIGGTDIRELTLPALRHNIAYAAQTPTLFSGSAADNLRWGSPAATDAQIQQACDIAQATDFITALPEGFDTLLGQGGTTLSGGQKQRLSLARALLRTAPILLLDDCTSALDTTTEAAVLHGLAATAADRTTVLITQRIGTALRAPRILCLEQGRMVGLGSHDELMQSCSVYREIYRSQIGGGDGQA